MMAVLEQVATFNPRLAADPPGHPALLASSAAARRSGAGRNAASSTSAIDPDYAASALGSMVDRSAYVWIVLGEPYEFETAVDAADPPVLQRARGAVPPRRLTPAPPDRRSPAGKLDTLVNY